MPTICKLPHCADQRSAETIVQHDAVDHLVGKNAQRNLLYHLGSQGAIERLLAFHQAEDGRLEKSFLVVEPAVNRAWSETGVVGNAGNGGAFNAMLSEYFRGGTQPFLQRLAAAFLLRFQRLFKS